MFVAAGLLAAGAAVNLAIDDTKAPAQQATAAG